MKWLCNSNSEMKQCVQSNWTTVIIIIIIILVGCSDNKSKETNPHVKEVHEIDKKNKDHIIIVIIIIIIIIVTDRNDKKSYL